MAVGGMLLLGLQHAHAQVFVDGTTFNNFGYVSNYDTHTEVTGAAGSAYTAAFGAIFDHFESATNTLRVNGAYNANGNGGSTDNFNGPLGSPGTQEVSGTVVPNFSTLVLKNGTASLFNITNTAGANVFTQASFQNGITTTVRGNTSAGELRFQNGASYTGGSTDAQHVNGYVGKVGNGAFNFPVGSGSDSRILSISAPASVTAHLSTAYETSNVEAATAVSDPVESVFTLGSWDWIAGSPADDDGLAITVSMPDVSGFAATANLRLIGWNGSEWTDLSGAANATGTTEGSTISGTIPAGVSITQIGIGSIAPPLPVTLVAFDVLSENQTALLSWSTTMETNSESFEVQRSIDARNWAPIGSVRSHGESSSLKEYKFSDNAPLSGKNYYRLKMIDNDGTFAYSRIRTAEFGGVLALWPNPAVDKITVRTGVANSVSRIQIVSTAGNVVLERSQPNGFEGDQAIDIRNLRTGTYIVRLILPDGSVNTHRFVKK
ncbi:Por secretion system C-terminal sorting domain-containing protein [Dyadobacter soli]|uniref:Por secretion system C-terminal sorting domain-containing protein n=2 Tax=Dyadobacter soli TaxID=659014 RepID=A0A1G7SJS2_9BACT|nr:Por secretion system C-terminal sorting domain-containing protein [Dyadobacter soli]